MKITDTYFRQPLLTALARLTGLTAAVGVPRIDVEAALASTGLPDDAYVTVKGVDTLLTALPAADRAKLVRRKVGFAMRNQREGYCATPLTCMVGKTWALTPAGVERAAELAGATIPTPEPVVVKAVIPTSGTLMTRESTPVPTRHTTRETLPELTPLAGDTIIYLLDAKPVPATEAHAAIRAGGEVTYQAYETDLAAERLLTLLVSGATYPEHPILAMRRADLADRPMVEAELAAEAEAALAA